MSIRAESVGVGSQRVFFQLRIGLAKKVTHSGVTRFSGLSVQ